MINQNLEDFFNKNVKKKKYVMIVRNEYLRAKEHQKEQEIKTSLEARALMVKKECDKNECLECNGESDDIKKTKRMK